MISSWDSHVNVSCSVLERKCERGMIVFVVEFYAISSMAGFSTVFQGYQELDNHI